MIVQNRPKVAFQSRGTAREVHAHTAYLWIPAAGATRRYPWLSLAGTQMLAQVQAQVAARLHLHHPRPRPAQGTQQPFHMHARSGRRYTAIAVLVGTPQTPVSCSGGTPSPLPLKDTHRSYSLPSLPSLPSLLPSLHAALVGASSRDSHTAAPLVDAVLTYIQVTYLS